MARGVTDPYAMANKLLKLRRLQSIIVSIGQRHGEPVKNITEDKAHARKFWVQFVAINKRYGNLVDEIADDMSQIVRSIERSFIKFGTEHCKPDDYDFYQRELDYYRGLQLQHVLWEIEAKHFLRGHDIQAEGASA